MTPEKDETSMTPEKDVPASLAVRLLSREEKQKTRFLYEEAFPEDGPELTDYYYEIKMAGNEVFAALDSTEHALGMLCLNPYRVMVRGTEYPLDYIVAVATEKAHRREGVMRSVLTAALRHLRSRSEALRARHLPGIPFTYLKPADPAYYSPFGFAYVSRRLRRALRQDVPVTRKM
ncbi:MAG: GNAT family N-acetyltransferase, partial [Stomatobaculum sp.]|nr:GNAT family N-acetyltransferase [Stomatobaculum sp.]